MKKISFLALTLLATLGMSAQQSVVKEAERAMKSNQDLGKVVGIITPALTNPETANQAKTWFIPGKTAFNQYDNILARLQITPTKFNFADSVKMSKVLIEGYDYFAKALELDALPDAKGKVKPKYTKDIANIIAGHFADFTNAGIYLFNDKDYAGAYKAREIVTTMPTVPVIAAQMSTPQGDDFYGEIAFNQAVAAMQMQDFEKALKAFDYAKSKGYNKKALYDYAMLSAQSIEKMDVLLAYAREALPLYGKEDPQYIGQIINHYLQIKDYDKAFSMIDEALATDPDNAQYHFIKGVLYDNTEKSAEAKACFKKAVDIDGRNSQALYNYGRKLCEEGYALADKAPADAAEYNKYFVENIKPLFIEAIDYLERAYDEDNNNTDPLKYLQSIYYNLNDEKNLKYTEQRLNQ